MIGVISLVTFLVFVFAQFCLILPVYSALAKRHPDECKRIFDSTKAALFNLFFFVISRGDKDFSDFELSKHTKRLQMLYLVSTAIAIALVGYAAFVDR